MESRQNHQMVMVNLQSKDCGQCNEVALKGMEHPGFSEKIKKDSIIAVLYNDKDPDWHRLSEKFNKPGGLILLFFSPSGELVHSFIGSTSLTSTYFQQVSIAQKNIGDEKAMKACEEAYASGNRDPDLLKQLIIFRNNSGKDTGPVLDDFAGTVSPDSLKSLNIIQFIARNAPVLNSYADSVMKSDRDRFNKAWYSMDLRTRSTINNKVIDKSIKKAISEKNNEGAISIASFASGVNTSNSEKLKAYNLVLARYFRDIKDTAGYFRYATVLYDGYYMKISVDSIETRDSLNRMQLLSNAPQQELSSNGNTRQFQRSITYTSTKQFFASDLNAGAFSFYTMKADDHLLKKALQWGSRSLEFFETPQNLDTYARLLYKTGKRDSAVYYQQKAVNLQLKNKFPAGEYDTVLKKMQKGEMKIDEY